MSSLSAMTRPAIETKWQSRWENEKTYACHVDKDKKNYYVLEMFPLSFGKPAHGPCT